MLTVEQTLKTFTRHPATDPADPLARVWHAKFTQPGLPIAWEIDVASDGRALAACIRGLDAAALPFDRRFELLRTEPANHKALLAEGCPRYWSAITTDPAKLDKDELLHVGFDADLFGRVAACQRRVEQQTRDSIKRAKPATTRYTREAADSASKKVAHLRAKRTTEEEIEAWSTWKAESERLEDVRALTEWKFGHNMAPALWSVGNPKNRYFLDECWVGAVMPWRIV